tara:strand:+ start:6469 stop:7539 length:1071 start_codon:yes stop_codon:yes gene_type:complete
MAKIINCTNVHEAFILGIDTFRWDPAIIEQDSRAGVTLEYPGPVITTFKNPCERVVFWEPRDANPFFHFMEGLWMLAGRDDVHFVTEYNKRMSSFSDNGVTFNGAYGYRWRNFFKKDQLDIIAKRLKNDHTDRRCVLSMWDCDNDLDKDTLDTPCNTHIYFKIRDNKLNMTVCCRSNDMIWGAYGANAVHMSMLQEYMAGRIGVDVGVYNQISDSYHVYKDLFKEMESRLPEVDYYAMKYPMTKSPYDTVSTYPMMPSDQEDTNFCELFEEDLNNFFTSTNPHFKHGFFLDVVAPMQFAWELHREKGNTKGAINMLRSNCKAEDWTLACTEWLERRLNVNLVDEEVEEKDVGPCHA